MNVEHRPDRLAATDRAIVGLTGSLALVCAVALMAAHRGWWGLRQPDAALLAPSLDDSWGANPERWAVVAAVAALLFALGAVWVVQRLGRARPRADVRHRLEVAATPVLDLRHDAPEASPAGGAVMVDVHVSASAVERLAEELAVAHRDVRSARASLLAAEGGRRTLALTLELPARVSLAAVQARLDDVVLPALGRCLGITDLKLEVRYTLSSEGPVRAS